jgi:hypothetical protein
LLGIKGVVAHRIGLPDFQNRGVGRAVIMGVLAEASSSSIAAYDAEESVMDPIDTKELLMRSMVMGKRCLAGLCLRPPQVFW